MSEGTGAMSCLNEGTRRYGPVIAIKWSRGYQVEQTRKLFGTPPESYRKVPPSGSEKRGLRPHGFPQPPNEKCQNPGRSLRIKREILILCGRGEQSYRDARRARGAAPTSSARFLSLRFRGSFANRSIVNGQIIMELRLAVIIIVECYARK